MSSSRKPRERKKKDAIPGDEQGKLSIAEEQRKLAEKEQRSLSIAQQVVTRVEQSFGQTSRNLCIPLQRLALVQNANGLRKEATETATRCCMLAQILEDPVFQAQSLTLMAIFALEQLEFQAAEQAASQVIVMLKEFPAESKSESVDTMEVQCLNVLGEAQRECGSCEQAFNTHSTALQLARKMGINAFCADATRGMGRALMFLYPQQKETVQVLNDARQLYIQAYGADSAMTARAMTEEAEVLRNCEDLDKALPLLSQAIAMHKLYSKPDSLDYAQTCKILSSTLFAANVRTEEALELISTAAEIGAKLAGKAAANTAGGLKLLEQEANALVYQGMMLERLKRFDEAATVQRKVITKYNKIAGAENEVTKTMIVLLDRYTASASASSTPTASSTTASATSGIVEKSENNSKSKGKGKDKQKCNSSTKDKPKDKIKTTDTEQVKDSTDVSTSKRKVTDEQSDSGKAMAKKKRKKRKPKKLKNEDEMQETSTSTSTSTSAISATQETTTTEGEKGLKKRDSLVQMSSFTPSDIEVESDGVTSPVPKTPTTKSTPEQGATSSAAVLPPQQQPAKVEAPVTATQMEVLVPVPADDSSASFSYVELDTASSKNQPPSSVTSTEPVVVQEPTNTSPTNTSPTTSSFVTIETDDVAEVDITDTAAVVENDDGNNDNDNDNDTDVIVVEAKDVDSSSTEEEVTTQPPTPDSVDVDVVDSATSFDQIDIVDDSSTDAGGVCANTEEEEEQPCSLVPGEIVADVVADMPSLVPSVADGVSISYDVAPSGNDEAGADDTEHTEEVVPSKYHAPPQNGNESDSSVEEEHEVVVVQAQQEKEEEQRLDEDENANESQEQNQDQHLHQESDRDQVQEQEQEHEHKHEQEQQQDQTQEHKHAHEHQHEQEQEPLVNQEQKQSQQDPINDQTPTQRVQVDVAVDAHVPAPPQPKPTLTPTVTTPTLTPTSPQLEPQRERTADKYTTESAQEDMLPYYILGGVAAVSLAYLVYRSAARTS